jgi:hypothetical protein
LLDLVSGHGAKSLGLDVLRLLLVELAEGFVGSQDGNISPGSRVPVGIIVTFFGAFVAVSVTVVVLTGEDGASATSVEVSFFFSVGDEETHVSLSVLAVLVVVVGFVHSVEQVSVTIEGSGRSGIVLDSVGGGTISDEDHGISIGVGADVLNNHVAIHSGVLTATVLSGPFDGQLRSFIVGHRGSDAITSLGVVLGVEQSVSIVSVCIGFIQSVVGASRRVHVKVTVYGA